MTKTILLLVCCLVCTAPLSAQKTTKLPARSVSLRNISRYANNYTSRTLKVSKVVLEDVRKLREDWPEYALQVYEPPTKSRLGTKGEGTTFDPYGFLICVDDLGKPLTDHREKWLNQKVNLYLRIRDMALTTNIYVGYVMKIELLDEEGKVVETLSSSN